MARHLQHNSSFTDAQITSLAAIPERNTGDIYQASDDATKIYEVIEDLSVIPYRRGGTTTNLIVDQSFLSQASINVQDMNAAGDVAITSVRTDTGWAISTNNSTYTGTPDSIEITVQVHQAIGQGANAQRPSPVLQLQKNGVKVIESATGYIRDTADHEESSNTIVWTDVNPGPNPVYDLVRVQESTNGAVVNSTVGHFTCKAIEKVSVINTVTI